MDIGQSSAGIERTYNLDWIQEQVAMNQSLAKLFIISLVASL